jgi:hypothetical protein
LEGYRPDFSHIVTRLGYADDGGFELRVNEETGASIGRFIVRLLRIPTIERPTGNALRIGTLPLHGTPPAYLARPVEFNLTPRAANDAVNF